MMQEDDSELPSPVATKFGYDKVDDKIIVERVQDIEPILEANKRAFNDASSTWKNDFHQVASIPLIIIEKWKKEKGIDLLSDTNAMKLFLNSPEHTYFRTRPGKI